jgi:hypothetical protein
MEGIVRAVLHNIYGAEQMPVISGIQKTVMHLSTGCAKPTEISWKVCSQKFTVELFPWHSFIAKDNVPRLKTERVIDYRAQHKQGAIR